jgi:protein-S-isoprenylcysteine O-methyltransferase Ste14
MLVARLIGSVVLNVAIFALLLFIPAGTLAWPRAWIFLGVVFVCAAATMFGLFLRGNQELLNERFKPPFQKEQPLTDKIILPIFIATFGGAIIFIPLDVFRIHLLGGPAPIVSLVGLVLFIAGWSVIAFALKENAFAAPVVKHQAERHQTVIDRGVYRVVRHPMYAGATLLMIGMPLWLGSYAATALAIVPIVTIALRILIEERFLTRELAGYDAYSARVRYRLIPFLW